MAFKDQGVPARVIEKMEKIAMCNIKVSSVTRVLWNEEIFRTSAKPNQKGKKGNYKDTEQWEWNLRLTVKRSTDSDAPKYFYKCSQ